MAAPAPPWAPTGGNGSAVAELCTAVGETVAPTLSSDALCLQRAFKSHSRANNSSREREREIERREETETERDERERDREKDIIN